MYDKFIESPNYQWGRSGYGLRYIVLHTTEGKGSGAVAWFQNPASQVSAHYVVTEDPVEIVMMVPEEHTAWHAGRIIGTPTTPLYDGINPNFESIGIEFAGYAAAPLAPQQVSTGAALIRDIRARYGDLPLVAHYMLSPGDRSDPGEYNYNWLVSETEGEDMTPDEVKAEIRNLLTSPEGANLVEFAVARPGGFADRLKANLSQGMADAVTRAQAEALKD